MSILSIVISIIAIIVASITLAALVEVFASVRMLQDKLGLNAESHDADVLFLEEVTKTVMARPPTDIGLRNDENELIYGFILFLSNRCSTCLSLVKHIKDDVPLGLRVVLVGDSPHALDWLKSLGASSVVDVVVEPVPELFDKFYLPITPAVLGVIEGEMAFVAAVDSPRALDRLVIDRFIPREAIAMRSAMAQAAAKQEDLRTKAK